MGRKRRAKPRQRRQTSVSHSEPGISHLRTPTCDFVRYEGRPGYVEYYLFRPGHREHMAAIIEKKRAGEEPDPEELKRLGRFGLLMVAIDEQGLEAHLFLDREKVDEEEVDMFIDAVYGVLDDVPSRPDGGVLTANWMEEIDTYSIF